MAPFSPEELNELAAGYVLGDLTSEEAALFQQQLQQDAALQTRVARLQDTLGMMALGVVTQETPPDLRSRIIQAVEPIGSPSTERIQEEQRSTNPSIREWMAAQPRRLSQGYRLVLLWGTGAALIAIAFGTHQSQLKQQIAMLETALSQQKTGSMAAPVREIPVPAGTALTMEAPAELLAQQWPGLKYLRQDHQQSHAQAPQPGTANLQNSHGIPKQLLDRLTPSPAMPRLLEKNGELEAQFVKITPCKMGKVQGLRMTYLLDQQTTVSVYKLEHGEGLPQPGTEAVSLQSTEGLSMVLWEEDTFLYAIVSDLPVNRLKNLTIDS